MFRKKSYKNDAKNKVLHVGLCNVISSVNELLLSEITYYTIPHM